MSDNFALLRELDGIAGHACLVQLEQSAVRAGLRKKVGLALVPLVPGCEVIQIVVVDGVHVGRVRRQYPGFLPERWVAVPPYPFKYRGPYKSAEAAAIALIALHTSIERIR